MRAQPLALNERTKRFLPNRNYIGNTWVTVFSDDVRFTGRYILYYEILTYCDVGQHVASLCCCGTATIRSFCFQEDRQCQEREHVLCIVARECWLPTFNIHLDNVPSDPLVQSGLDMYWCIYQCLHWNYHHIWCICWILQRDQTFDHFLLQGTSWESVKKSWPTLVNESTMGTSHGRLSGRWQRSWGLYFQTFWELQFSVMWSSNLCHAPRKRGVLKVISHSSSNIQNGRWWN